MQDENTDLLTLLQHQKSLLVEVQNAAAQLCPSHKADVNVSGRNVSKQSTVDASAVSVIRQNKKMDPKILIKQLLDHTNHYDPPNNLALYQARQYHTNPQTMWRIVY